jgi:ketosteroid isomerase-like protein
MQTLTAVSPQLGKSLLAVWLMCGLVAPCLGQPGAMPRSERHESRHEIDQLEEDWREAVLKPNTTAMEALLADDYVAITASGMLQSKDQAIASLRSGATRFTSLDLFDRKVRFYGTTAVVTSIANIHAVMPDGDANGSFRYTRVYVRNPQGNWKIVSFEASKIRESSAHK